MKVLFCYITAEPVWAPNIEIQTAALAREFPEDTYYIVCLETTRFAFQNHPENMKVIAIPPGRHQEWTRYRLLKSGIAKLARELRVDVIWSVNVGLYHRSGIAQILGLRNAFEVYPWKIASLYAFGPVHLAAMRYCFRKSARCSDAVIAQTSLIAEHLRQIRGMPSRVVVIPKTVESLSDVPAEPLPDPIVRQLGRGLGREAFTFVYAAARILHKNHAVLVKAMEILRRDEVKARIALTFPGDQLFATFGDAGRSLVETGHLLPLGKVGKEHLRTLYDACDGCVMPSLLESLSSSHLEAMQWEKPQVSADLPFVREVCGDASLYAGPTDPDDWAAKMRILIDNRTLRGELIAAGRRQMERYPKTWAETSHHFHQFLCEVVEAKRQGRQIAAVAATAAPATVESAPRLDRPAKPKMRILIQHISRSDIGGGFANVAALVKTIIKDNPDDRFLFVCLESSRFYPMDGCPNAEFIRLKPAFSLEFQRLHLMLRGLPRIARQWRPDVIWSFNLGPYVHTGVPQVVGIINAFQVYPPSIAKHHPRGAIHTAFIRWFSRLTLKMSDAAIVETNLMADYVRKVSAVPSRILVAPKAVGPLEASSSRPLPGPIAQLFDAEPGKGAFTFLYMANCVSHKNHKTIIEAAAALRSQCRFRLALSSTPKDLAAAGGTAAEELIRDGYILPMGFVASEDLRAVYDACDACVMPSLLESQSSSHLEAMLWRKPQICADLPYAHDLCGDAAVYAAAQNPADWAAKMRMLIEDRALRERLVAAGAARMKRFPETWLEVARQVRGFLGEVAEKK